MGTRRALITGSAGFTGSYLLAYLQEVDPELTIVGIDRNDPPYPGAYEFVQVNVLDGAAVRKVISEVKPTHVFHLAGVNFSDDPKLFYEINVIGTMNLLEAVSRNSGRIAPKVLIVGSSAEYGSINENELPVSEKNPLRPISHYGVSKAAQTLLGFRYFKSCGLKVIRVRPFNLIGPGQSADFVCGALTRQIVEVEERGREPELLVGNLDPERDFVDVRDVVDAYWQLLSTGSYGEVYNVGSGKSYSIREVLKILLREAGTKITVKQDRERMRQSDIPRQISNIDKIRRETSWAPRVPLEQSLRDMLDYSRAMLRHSP